MKVIKENKDISPNLSSKNPIVKMIEDKKRITAAIENGESITNLKGIKIVSPL